MQSIADIFKKLRERHPEFQKRLEEAKALNAWAQAVGPSIARHTRPLRVEKQTLIVEVDHPVWQTELHYRKGQIIEALSKLIELNPITDLQFRIKGPEATERVKKDQK